MTAAASLSGPPTSSASPADLSAGLTISGVSKHFSSPSFPWQEPRAGKWALRDISLTVNRGEILGIVGPNGSGKTTLLRLIAGVSQPTSGTLWRCGSVAALLDLSGGFHPNLTGWQNLFLGASLAGLTRQEVRERMGTIVDFSGLSTADLDRPVREWSAGMIARLGFSIAVGVDPEVIVVDEVLAVGDAGFQARCARRLLQFRDEGKTMVMVSHVTAVLRNVADRLLWIDQGEMRALGPVPEVADAYESTLRRRIAARRHQDAPALPQSDLADGQQVHLRMENLGLEPDGDHWSLRATVEWSGGRVSPTEESGWVAYSLVMETGVLLDEGWLALPLESGMNGAFHLHLDFESLPLMPGSYELVLAPCHGPADAMDSLAPPPQPAGQVLVMPFRIPGQRFAADQYPVHLPVDFRLGSEAAPCTDNH
jgi:ABC-type polysaccharide/polyol phosphate transport system ATPase subunit